MRQQLTEQLADSISLSYQQAEDEWWFSKSKTGLRLADDGFHIFVTKLDIQYYVWKPQDSIKLTPKILLRDGESSFILFINDLCLYLTFNFFL